MMPSARLKSAGFRATSIPRRATRWPAPPLGMVSRAPRSADFSRASAGPARSWGKHLYSAHAYSTLIRSGRARMSCIPTAAAPSCRTTMRRLRLCSRTHAIASTPRDSGPMLVRRSLKWSLASMASSRLQPWLRSLPADQARSAKSWALRVGVRSSSTVDTASSRVWCTMPALANDHTSCTTSLPPMLPSAPDATSTSATAW
mmetsp:Transcript_1509/g.4027  ORF Transcript_1509/g.4027 Transcript_1509/m.4027 type:complete len:202 (-) Transcript_1509:801-1406(-)